MKKEIKTNRAVSALVFKDDKFLLLKRVGEPQIWGPPGGRVSKGETMGEAIKREILEETGLSDVEILMPITFWAGKHGKDKLEAICFLAEYHSGKVVLSDEHEAYQWADVDKINKLSVTHSLKDFKLAQKIIKIL
jgi:8-oxo-dGTP diphosphatase